MGFSQEIDTESKKPPNDSDFSATAENRHCRDRELKIKSILVNMICRFGLPCVRPDSGKIQNENDTKSKNLENNKAWLLAESGGCGAESINADPHSLHSSFRFSLCSQIELESMKMSSSTAATVLMVNLDNGVSERRAKELAWRRIETVEKNISPVANTLIRFSHGEILSATHNFSKGRVLGRGALSWVFRGRIGHLKTAVAIKRLEKEDKESAKAFCRELMIASSLQSPNIVSLLGFCIDPEEGLFLVYKYVSGGSLERHLHEKKKRGKGRSPLPWPVRYKVAVGVAEAVAYLHNGTERCIVHRDIKPSNILLSSKKSPKLCDFGLATWTSAPSVPFLCKTVKGTFGYLAPEYFQHGKISDKTDVYALGVVLLELITGRKPIESNGPPGEENLLLWAKPLLQKGKAAIEDLLDPRLKSTFKASNQIARVIEAAAACIMTEESRRPRINEILALLKSDEESLNPESKKSSYLGHGFATECHPQSEQSESEMKSHLAVEMKSHLAVAMLGVAEFEDDDQSL